MFSDNKKSIIFNLSLILENLAKVEDYTADLEEEEFQNDEKLKDAVRFNIEKSFKSIYMLPDDFKEQYTNIKWSNYEKYFLRQLAGNYLVQRNTWYIATNEIPELYDKIDEVFKYLENNPEKAFYENNKKRDILSRFFGKRK